jgi:hypothetical protein
MARGADIGIIEHGVAEATHATVGRRLSFGKNVCDPILRLRIRQTEPDAFERFDHAERSIESRITA